MKKIDDLLNFDGLAEAEKVTGKSYKNDKGTESLGFLAVMLNAEEKNQALIKSNDTHNGISADDTFILLEENGFELLSKNDYERKNPYTTKGDIEESSLVFYWNPTLHILVKLETYPSSKRINENSTGWDDELFEPYIKINSINMKYTIRPTNINEFWSNCVSSGGMNGDVFVGDHDIREGFVHKLNKLKEYGEFQPWLFGGGQFLYFNHYMFEDNYDREDEKEKIIAQWPDDIKEEILNGSKYLSEFAKEELKNKKLVKSIDDALSSQEVYNNMNKIKTFEDREKYLNYYSELIIRDILSETFSNIDIRMEVKIKMIELVYENNR